jgi:transposase-like protein
MKKSGKHAERLGIEASGRGGHRRDPRKEAFWQQAIREQAASGTGVRAFCRERGLAEASFHHWRRELRLRGIEIEVVRATAESEVLPEPPRLPAFAELRLPEETLPPAEVEIVRGDLTIRFRGPLDTSLLREAVGLLSGSSC